jgi:hypothetical protein
MSRKLKLKYRNINVDKIGFSGEQAVGSEQEQRAAQRVEDAFDFGEEDAQFAPELAEHGRGAAGGVLAGEPNTIGSFIHNKKTIEFISL